MRLAGLEREELIGELGLSAEQAEAVGLEEDAVIAAGAGAGKTTTLVGAVAHDLLVAGIEPRRICVATFTRAATANMISRLGAVLERFASRGAPDLGELWIGTIDAIAARVLRENAIAAGVSPGFHVADERDLRPLRAAAIRAALDSLSDDDLRALALVFDTTTEELSRALGKAHERLALLGIDAPRTWVSAMPHPGPALEALEALASCEGVTIKQKEEIQDDIEAIRAGALARVSNGQWGIKRRPAIEAELERARQAREEWRQMVIDDHLARAREAMRQLIERFEAGYCERKRAADLLEYVDLVERAQQIAVPMFERTYIDEAQDTSPQQYRLLRSLSRGPVISIGDVNQSIYGFRGADVENFRAETAGQRRVELADNYRSRPELLAGVNALCGRFPELADLIRMRSAGPKSKLPAPDRPPIEALCIGCERNQAPSAEAEAEIAAAEIAAAARRRGVALSDVCVLAPTNPDVEAYAKAFRAIGVPALAVQRRGLFRQSEVEDVVAYLRLLADPDDEQALVRVLSSPFAGLSDERLREILADRTAELRALRGEGGERLRPGDPGYPALSEWVARHEPAFWRRHSQIIARRGSAPPSALLRWAIELHGYDLALEALDETGARARNVEKALAVMAEIEHRESGSSARALCERIEDEREADDSGQDEGAPRDVDAVRVMTVHQAKGDEFKMVAVCRLARRPPPRRDKLVVDAQGRLGLRWREAGPDRICKEACEAEDERSAREHWRNLYVALTRAEEHLLLVGASYRTKRSGEIWLDPFPFLVDPDEIPAEPGEERLVDLGGGAQMLVRRVAAGEDRELEAIGSRDAGDEAELEGELAPTDPQLPPARGGVISYTALTSWRRCPLRRRLEHELGLRELGIAGTGEAAGEASEGARRFGIALHRALARLDWKRAQAQPAAAIASALAACGLAEDECAWEMLDRLLESPLAGELAAARAHHAEREFRLRLGRHLIAGKIDLHGELPGEALIIDWKSGDDPDDVFGSDYELQRRLYALAALSAPDAPERVRAASHYLESGETVVETFERSELKRLHRDLRAEIAGILEAQPQPAAAEEQPFCAGCPGRERLCPVAGAAKAQGDVHAERDLGA